MSQSSPEMTSNATDFAAPSPPVAVEPPREQFRTLGIVGFVDLETSGVGEHSQPSQLPRPTATRRRTLR